MERITLDGVEQTSNLKAELFIAAGGLATGVLAAVVNFLFAQGTDGDIASVLPHGAGAMGLLAASGYYFAAIVARQRPTRRVLVNMLLIGFGCFALTEYLAYQALTVDGVRVADVLSFWDYYRVKVEHVQVRSLHDGGRPSPELGSLGYVWEFGRLCCFLLGSGLASTYLQNKPYCETCKRYFGRRRMLLKARDTAKVNEFVQTLWLDTSSVGEEYERRVGKQRHYGFRVWLSGCKTCGTKLLTFAVAHQYTKQPFAAYSFRGESLFRKDLSADESQAEAPAEPAHRKVS